MRVKPISLAILLQDLEFGGSQRHALQLLGKMDRGLFSVELWVLRRGDDLLPLADPSVNRIVWLSKSSWVSPKALFRLLLRLYYYRPSVLYTLTVVPNIWGRVFGRIAGVPVILSSYRNAVAKQYERRLWRLSTCVVCNAAALEEILIRQHGVDRRRIAVIPNGVDVDYFQPHPEMRDSQPTIIFVGRLVDQKDPLNLLKGFRMVAEKLPEARLIVLGNGHLRDSMQAFIRSNGLRSRVSLLPGICDIRSHLRRAWVFALSSRYEGSPNAVLEAMAAGLPIVATSVGGVPEILRDGQTGLLVEPGDPVALAHALTDLLQNQPLREAMGEKAREAVVRVHSLDKMVSETERLIAGAVNQSGPSCGEPSSFIPK